MRHGELRKRIVQRLEPALLDRDVRYRRSELQFVRRIEGGIQSISIAITDYRPVFLFAPTFRVRLNEVEAIFNRFNRADPGYHRLTLSMIAQSEEVLGHGEWEEQTDADLIRAVEEMAVGIETRGMAFLDANCDLLALDRSINPRDGISVDRSASPYREMHALIVAYLASNPELDALADAYLADLPRDHVGRGDLMEVIGYLGEIRRSTGASGQSLQA